MNDVTSITQEANVKTCTKCLSQKSELDFAKNGKRGLNPRCKQCLNATVRAWREANSETTRLSQRNTQRKYRSANMLKITASRHRLSTETYNTLLSFQSGVCANATCGSDGNGRRLVIDHDHSCCAGKYSCGKCIRGLLCGNCNKGIGLLRDSVSVMEGAIDYLRTRTFKAGLSAGIV